MSRRESIAQAANLAQLEFYRFKRYQTPFTVALICFEEALPEGLEERLRHTVRRTDLIEELTHCSLLIIFGHTTLAEARLAMRHLHHLIEKQTTIYHAGLATAEAEDDRIERIITRAVEEMAEGGRCLEC
jgi:hypothetical protein